MSASLEALCMLGAVVGILAWVIGGSMLAFNTHDRLESRDLPVRACIVGAALAGLLAPLWIGRGLKWLGGACAELYRYRFPRKTTLPKARVVL